MDDSSVRKRILDVDVDGAICDLLVDDGPRSGAAGFGVRNPAGERPHFGSERLPGWDAVLPYLRERA